jgi:hypothetical protein
MRRCISVRDYPQAATDICWRRASSAVGTQHPREVWLAVDRCAAIPKVDVAPVRVVRISGAALTAGIDEHDIEGVTVHVQIDVGFGDAITPAALDLDFPTLLVNMPSPNALAPLTETIVPEKVEAMVDLGRSNSRMKDFTDLPMAARRVALDGDPLVAAIRATFDADIRRA